VIKDTGHGRNEDITEEQGITDKNTIGIGDNNCYNI
jgi:hypothetical protein